MTDSLNECVPVCVVVCACLHVCVCLLCVPLSVCLAVRVFDINFKQIANKLELSLASFSPPPASPLPFCL